MMNKIVGIHGVLFDFDETLNNTLLGSEIAWNEVAKLIQEFLYSHQISVNRDRLRQEIEHLDDAMNQKSHYNRDDWWDQFLCQKMGNTPPKEFVARVTTTYWEAIVEGSQLYPDTLATLRYLTERKYRLGLMSDTDRLPGMKRRRIRQSGLEKWFDAIVVSGEEGLPTKPAPEPFQALASQLHLSPEDCVFIGDKPFTDIKGAKDVGMITILIQRRKWDLLVEPDYRVNTLQELQNLL